VGVLLGVSPGLEASEEDDDPVGSAGEGFDLPAVLDHRGHEGVDIRERGDVDLADPIRPFLACDGKRPVLEVRRSHWRMVGVGADGLRSSPMATPIVLIHGAWVSPACWDSFKARYEARGYEVLAPPWPFDDRPIAELRADPDPRLAHSGIPEIVDHYASIIRGLPEPPILIGHSFGGLFVQILVDRGLGAAGVAINPAPPRGVAPGPTAFHANLPALLAPFGWARVLTMPFGRFRKTFLNTLGEDEARAVYDAHVIPTAGRMFWDGLFTRGASVTWRNPARPPLLLITGTLDRTVGAGMNRQNFSNYRNAPSRTDFHEFPGRSHWIIAEPGWEEVADFAIEWVEGL
jgi:pimeloyl-ACP methyl ester carboxylesterase